MVLVVCRGLSMTQPSATASVVQSRAGTVRLYHCGSRPTEVPLSANSRTHVGEAGKGKAVIIYSFKSVTRFESPDGGV